MIRTGATTEVLAVTPAGSSPQRKAWKQDLAPYLEVDRGRSLAQLASVVLPYLGVWALAWLIRPNAWLAIGLGLVATVFLVRMYSLFHDLTHNSMFDSRATNRRWGHALGFLLFTPYRWWQREHSLHHAHTGNLEKRGPGEIYTMTLAEYGGASRARRLGYRAYRNPLLMLLVGPSLVFLFERRFPQRGMSRRILVSVVVTNLALVAWAVGWSAVVGWGTFLLIQGTTLVAGGAVAAWMLYIQHQYEGTYYESPGQWQFELAALQGSSYLKLPRATRLGRRQCQLPPRAPPEREDPELPPACGARGAARVCAHAGRDHPQQHRRVSPEAVGRGERPPRPLPQISGGGLASRRAREAARGRRRPPSPSAAGRSSTARRPAVPHRASTSRRHPSGRSPVDGRSRRR